MDPGKRWWWISYTDDSRPKGDRALGACIVQHGGGFSHAAGLAKELGLQPAGESVEALGGIVDQKWGDPPLIFVGRHLKNEEATRLARLWCGGVADEHDIRAAFADDQAKIGDPLFKGRG